MSNVQPPTSNLQSPISTTQALQAYQVMRFGSMLLTSVLLAKSRLSTADIGSYELLLYLGSIVAFFWVNGLLQGMSPMFTRLAGDERKAFIFNVFLIFCGISAALFVLLFLGEHWISPLLTGQGAVPCYRWFCVYLLFNLPTFPVESIYLLQERPRQIVAWGVASFGLYVVALFAPILLGYGLCGGLAALAVWSMLRWLWAAQLALRYGLPGLRTDLWKRYFRFSWPLMLNVLVGNFILLFDSWLVGWYYHDEAIFAIFRYGSRELPLATALATALGTAMIPRLAVSATAGLAELKSKTRQLMHLLFPVPIGLLFVSKPLFPFVFNASFAASAPLFNIYLLLTASRVLLPNDIVLAQGHPGAILRIGMAELAVKIGLGFLLINWFGLPGLAWSAVLAFWVEKLGLMWFLEKRTGLRTSQWLDIRWYSGYVLALAAAWTINWLIG
jgi:O-antigen/teichoic acid export membrane protein